MASFFTGVGISALCRHPNSLLEPGPWSEPAASGEYNPLHEECLPDVHRMPFTKSVRLKKIFAFHFKFFSNLSTGLTVLDHRVCVEPGAGTLSGSLGAEIWLPLVASIVAAFV